MTFEENVKQSHWLLTSKLNVLSFCALATWSIIAFSPLIELVFEVLDQVRQLAEVAVAQAVAASGLPAPLDWVQL